MSLSMHARNTMALVRAQDRALDNIEHRLTASGYNDVATIQAAVRLAKAGHTVLLRGLTADQIDYVIDHSDGCRDVGWGWQAARYGAGEVVV